MLERSRFGNHRVLLTFDDFDQEAAMIERAAEPKPDTDAVAEDTASAIGYTCLVNGTHTTEIMGVQKPVLGEIFQQERQAKSA